MWEMAKLLLAATVTFITLNAVLGTLWLGVVHALAWLFSLFL